MLDGRGRNLPGFPVRTQGPIWGTASPVTADLTGQGYQDILVPTLQGLEIYDGRSGALVGSLPGTEAIGMQNTPLVSQRDDGTVEITIAGYQGTSDHCAPGLSGCLQGVIAEYVVNNLGATIGNPKLSWPMFAGSLDAPEAQPPEMSCTRVLPAVTKGIIARSSAPTLSIW
ncbi:MAG: hypothetical protein NT160_05505 [Actinobacteria bacterium]|nr:hypothetical protein [Actinomycetota bacterium]